MHFYKSVLHHPHNALPSWYLEAIGVFVSSLNGCDYCVRHHAEGFKRCCEDHKAAEDILEALGKNDPESVFGDKYLKGLRYAEKLTIDQTNIDPGDMDRLRKAGFPDGEILEVNQVASYFNYVNRSVLGLGVDTKGEVLGRSPGNSGGMEKWTHS